jgi:hypothetical protein
MAFTEQHKVFMVMSYFRNGVKIDGVWQYSLALCMEEFGEEFPDIAVEYTQFRQTLNICLKNFQENGSVGRKPGSGRPKKSVYGKFLECSCSKSIARKQLLENEIARM